MRDLTQKICDRLVTDEKVINSVNEKVAVSSRYRSISFYAKLIFTAFLLFLVYTSLDHQSLFEQLSELSFLNSAIIFSLYLLSQLVSSFKWRIFLSEAGINIPQRTVTKAFFLGMFINAFGLGTVGGDMARALSIPCPKGYRSAAIASVLADRIHGLTTLLMIGLFAVLIVQPIHFPSALFSLLLYVLPVLLVSWLIGPRLLLRILPEHFPFRIKIQTALAAFPRSVASLFMATCISVLFHSIQIFMACKIFETIRTPISTSLAFTTIPFINAASAMPFSINGLGVREVVGIYLLQPAGVLPESSAAFAAVWIITVTLVSGISGLFVVPSITSKLFSQKG
ncbi:MAG TPA: lysylphosphatidylglycerol synthase transmembrane domain-containing protein [Oligoflexia bacterium]|nr:lysylphosphatidylglycerol synthase transmembrane domain-containing protein [Oligoflexia bacterium]HMP49185.1 lysylphosphatidylglycerol synthase transmembrane domain-containing protein [Oligoflexia bacterium]